jgi:hypothetical protein
MPAGLSTIICPESRLFEPDLPSGCSQRNLFRHDGELAKARLQMHLIPECSFLRLQTQCSEKMPDVPAAPIAYVSLVIGA